MNVGQSSLRSKFFPVISIIPPHVSERQRSKSFHPERPAILPRIIRLVNRPDHKVPATFLGGFKFRPQLLDCRLCGCEFTLETFTRPRFFVYSVVNTVIFSHAALPSFTHSPNKAFRFGSTRILFAVLAAFLPLSRPVATLFRRSA